MWLVAAVKLCLGVSAAFRSQLVECQLSRKTHAPNGLELLERQLERDSLHERRVFSLNIYFAPGSAPPGF